ncbi:MAG: hypothetical protein VX899_17530 [Myxococcota bacterium]|nr:hypothetical protein [Myxococcota bacterium]
MGLGLSGGMVEDEGVLAGRLEMNLEEMVEAAAARAGAFEALGLPLGEGG